MIISLISKFTIANNFYFFIVTLLSSFLSTQKIEWLLMLTFVANHDYINDIDLWLEFSTIQHC